VPVVTRTFFGQLTSDDLFNSMIEIEGDARFDRLRHAISDFIAVTSDELTEVHVVEHAAIDRAAAYTNPDLVISIVATDQRILELAASYVASRLAPYAVKTFPTLADARRYAGLSAAGP